ncbi:unnamed protein product [Clonostachys solani]|uniref:Uncharacterized protein n=1 Tax=Clonostachys solani TaxID=160281 RepID=A0A9N9Z8A9_9HYPO|nr:unnamed protein product [Clonostachys solani]
MCKRPFWKTPLLWVLPRCRICRFSLEEGEDFVIVTVDGYRTQSFTYSANQSFQDEDLRRRIYCSKYVSSWLLDEVAIACHRDCLKFACKLVPWAEFRPASDREASSIAKARLNYSGTNFKQSRFKNNLIAIYGRYRESIPADAHSPSEQEMVGDHSTSSTSSSSINQGGAIGTPISRLFANSIYWYDPTPSEEQHRLQVLREELGWILSETLSPSGKLPCEISTLIADHLIQYYTTTASLVLPYEGESTVGISNDIWATYIQIDGRSYISGLSNVPTRENMKLILQAGSRHGEDTLYILGDHMGIHEIHFSSGLSEAIKPTEFSSWWRVLPLDSKQDKLSFFSDGTKLQSLSNYIARPNSQSPLLAERMLWAEPITPNELSSLKYVCLRWYDVCSHGLGTSRMVPATINAPGCAGYSVYFRPRPDNDAILGLSGFHAHRAGQALDFHRTAVYCPSNAVCTFVPMKDGERVHQVWYGCSLQPVNASHLALTYNVMWQLVTSSGRCLIIIGSSHGGCPVRRRNIHEKEKYVWKLAATASSNVEDRLWLVYDSSKNDVLAGLAGPRAGEDVPLPSPLDITTADFTGDEQSQLCSESPSVFVWEQSIC